jgi:D-beta-D-heptose 7-phosphate kinase/D-beta-D-heptose 1-phosphate adenosyltransferase
MVIIENKIKNLEEIKKVIDVLHRQGKRFVFTNGCFDLLHAAHIKYLIEAKAHGDILIIGLNSDSSIRSLKGPKRPLVPEDERALMLAALEFADYIVIFNDKTVENLLKELKPDIYVKGGDYSIDTINQQERRIVEGNNGKIVLVKGYDGYSTTNLIKRVLDVYK